MAQEGIIMLLFLLGRILRLLTLLVAVSVLSFLLLELSPIDPVRAYVGADMLKVGPEQWAKIAEHWGLDQPLPERFARWGMAILRGDFGVSMIFRRPVLAVIGERFLASLALMLTAWVFSGVFGFALGVLAGMKQGTWTDRLIKWYCLTLASTPLFWLALLMLLTFAVWLSWFPIGLGVPAGVPTYEVTLSDRLYHLLLPALTLSITGVAGVALHTRQKLVEVLQSDYVLFARARGESGLQVLLRHGLRNIALPVTTLQFASFSELFGGSILAEQVFSYPGLGQAAVQAGLRGDVPLLLGVVAFSALFVFAGNLAAELLYWLIDPRLRPKGDACEQR